MKTYNITKITKIIILILSLNCMTITQAAPPINTVSYPQPAQPQQYTNFNSCIKTYPISNESLLYMSLSAISENGYKVDEIQFKTGTILFSAGQKQFILTTARKDIKNTFIKILPADNNYNFAPTAIQKIFAYIDLNKGLGVQSII